MTGELTRARLGAGVEEPLAWLAGLSGPVRACYRKDAELLARLLLAGSIGHSCAPHRSWGQSEAVPH
jgi:hypothetical protein